MVRGEIEEAGNIENVCEENLAFEFKVDANFVAQLARLAANGNGITREPVRNLMK